MVKESEKVTRIDVRIPNEIYEQIEIIAKETNQPLHHRSGKPIVTPIILNLINLGLEEVAKGEFDLEVLTDKVSANNRLDIKQIEDRILEAVSDKLGSNQVDIEEIEKKLLASLETKIEAMIETKINELISDKISELESDSNDNFNQSIKEILSLEDLEDNSEINEADIREEIPTDTETLLSAKLEVIENNHNSSQTNSDANQLSLIEDITDNSSHTFEDSVNEIKRLRKSLGANYAKIARRLTENNYPTKQGKYKWSGTQVKRILNQ